MHLMNLLSILNSGLYINLSVQINFNTKKKCFLRELQDLAKKILIKPDDWFFFNTEEMIN